MKLKLCRAFLLARAERGICQNHIVFTLVKVLGLAGKAIIIVQMCGPISMENHVHEPEFVDEPYLLHGAQVFFFEITKHPLSLATILLSADVIIADVLEGPDDEPAGPAGRIIDEFSRPWGDELNHPVDDVARGEVLSELFVLPEFLEQVLISTAENVVAPFCRLAGHDRPDIHI